MKESTKQAISAIIRADDTIPAKTAEEALRLLDGKDGGKLGRVMRASEVARLLGMTTKTVRWHAKKGALVGVYLPGNVRRIGYTEESVRKVLAGKEA